MRILLVGIGGFLGSVVRYLLSSALSRGGFPLGTLTVNLIGCVVLGAVSCFADQKGGLAPETAAFLIVGLIGGFTTFSAFGYETFDLLRNGRTLHAFPNVAANVLGGLAMVLIGRLAANALR